MRMAGYTASDAATWSSTAYDSGLSADLPVSKFTPRRISVGRAAGAPGVAGLGWNRMMQPLASTFEPGGVFGHLSALSGTPSRSVSRTTSLVTGAAGAPGATGQPEVSTVVPSGVFGH